MLKNDEYIEQRTKQAKQLSRLFKLMWILPINNKKIVFSTFEGDGGFCCNPRYIAKEIHDQNLNYKIVWLTNDVGREFPEYIKVVKNTNLNKVYQLATAKMWIDNYRKPYGTLKRKGQTYIQTWHASIGFKAVGLFRGDAFPKIARIVSEWDSNLIDYVISNSEYCDKVYPQKLLYSGKTLRVGSPRVDCLINDKDKLRKEIREKYNINQDEKLLLFAPTFRGGDKDGKKQVVAPIPSVDFDRLLKSLEEKYNCRWKVLLRLHPQLSAKMDTMPLNHEDERLVDVSQAPDISEVMAACDLVLTDYSSCAFDAAFAQIPVLLYADDVEDYIANRGKFMWEKEELPFLKAKNNDELIKNVELFNLEKYQNEVSNFMLKNKVEEKGSASREVVSFIKELINEKEN